MIAPMYLQNFIVDQLTFKTDLDKKEPLAGKLGVDFEIKANPADKTKFLIRMQIDWNKGQAFKKNGGHQIHMQLLGWFNFTEELAEDARNNMLLTNATSILYGVARTIGAQLTATLGRQKIIFPAVNLIEIAKRKAHVTAPQARSES